MNKHQTPEEKFDVAMRDPRLVDEAAGFISDLDSRTVAALVANIYAMQGEDPDDNTMCALGNVYWGAITRAQLRIAKGEF